MAGPERLDFSNARIIDPADIEQQGEEAGIGQKRASAASSAASATQTTTLLPPRKRKEEALAEQAEIKAAEMRDKLAKLQQMASGRPTYAGIDTARKTLLNEIQNLSQSLDLSENMHFATGLGSSIAGADILAGSPTNSIEGLLAPIMASEAFETLSKLRAQSPTGGALGAITEKELELLKYSVAAPNIMTSDKVFQQEIKKLIQKRLDLLSKLGVDPKQLVTVLGPERAKEFAPNVKAYRFDSRDEKAINDYVVKSAKDGTFDPETHASYMVQAYQNATGNQPDETFIKGALDNAYRMQESIGKIQKGRPYAGVNYNVADQSYQKAFKDIAEGTEAAPIAPGEVAAGAAINFVPSVFEVGLDTVKAVSINAPDTLAGLGMLTAEVITGAKDKKTARAYADYFKDRYGSIEGFKKAMMTDPASFLADAVGLATAGSSLVSVGARTASRFTKVQEFAEAAKKADLFTEAASKLDPVVIAANLTGKTATGAKKVVEALTIGVPARSAGASIADVKQSFKAGREGSPEFVAQMEGSEPPAVIVKQLNDALSQLFKRRGAQYRREMRRLKQNPETLDFVDIDAALDDAKEIGTHTIGAAEPIDISTAAEVWDRVNAMVDEFRQKGASTVEDFDKLKQGIYNIAKNYPVGSPQHTTAMDVAKAINTTIVAKAPKYAEVMADYRLASDTLSDLQASLSTGAASTDTILNKLKRASSGKGPRGRTVLDLLEETPSGKGLSNRIAGFAMSGQEPAALTGPISTGAALATGDPAALLANVATPRGIGETAYGLGRQFGRGERAFSSILETVGLGRDKRSEAAKMLAKYAPGAAVGLRIANPLAIQPFTSDFEFNPPTEEEIRRSLLARYADQPPVPTVMGGPEVGLDVLRQRYLEQNPMGTGPILSIPEQVSAQGAAPEEEAFARGGFVIAPSAY